MATIVPAAEAGAAIGTFVGGPIGTVIGATVGVTAGVGITIFALYTTFRKEAKQAKKKALQNNDPVQFRKDIEKLSKEYIISLSKLDFKKQVLKKSDKIDVVFFGTTSAGKSSLINKLYNLKLSIGLGQTTNQTTMVYQDNKKRIWDSVGQNQDFQFYTYHMLLFFNTVDIVFIVYRDTIKTIKHMVNLICLPQNVRYKFYFIRSQCDQWMSIHEKSIDEQIMTDYQILKEYGVKSPIILKSSAIVSEPKDFKNQNSCILKIIEDRSK